MADFSSDLSEFKSSFPILDIDPNMESISHQNLLMDNSDLINFHTSMPFYYDSFSNHQTQLAEFPGIFPENFPPNFLQNNQNIVPLSFHHHPLSVPGVESESKKRKALDVSDCSSMNSSPQVSDNGKGKNISRRGKKAKGKEQEEKPKEVVHVRARRGQATDSHSLAERVRRGKINERLRCLQDIVPGCYKTMGMAVMLDEIINYVQSLQNQVEFLSMKLTAASTFYNFNSETDVIETMQIIKTEEAKENKHMKH